MSALIRHHQILALWIGFLVINGSAIVAALVWAFRAGQFSGQDHARFLAIEAGDLDASAPSRIDKEKKCSS